MVDLCNISLPAYELFLSPTKRIHKTLWSLLKFIRMGVGGEKEMGEKNLT